MRDDDYTRLLRELLAAHTDLDVLCRTRARLDGDGDRRTDSLYEKKRCA